MANAYITEPEVVSTLVSRVFGAQGANPIQYLTSGMSRQKQLNNREYDWFLQGDDEKAIPVIANLGD
ncbi:MAG: hypothetical protein KAS39_03675, partial [Actinomycetia bacterium]|nr:hypothetical protein [Actinomycetes bacterium]